MVTDLDEAPIEIVRGSGNVFADLGLPDPEERQTKLRLAMEVNEIIKARRLKQRSPQDPCTDHLGGASYYDPIKF